MIEQPKTLTPLFIIALLYLIFIVINGIINFILPGYNFDGNIMISIIAGVAKYAYILVAALIFFALSSLLRDYAEKQAIQTSFIVYGAIIILPNIVSLIFNMSQTSFVILGYLNFAVVITLCVTAFLVKEPKISRYFRIIGLAVLLLHVVNIVAPMILLPYISSTYSSYKTLQLMYTVIFFVFALPIPITIIAMVKNIARAKPVFKMPKEEY